jgi:hypothetical protein
MTQQIQCDWCKEIIIKPSSAMASLLRRPTWKLVEDHALADTTKDFCSIICATRYLIKRCEEESDKMKENNQSLERIDIKRSEPPLVQGENPCVKVTNEINKEISKDYDEDIVFNPDKPYYAKSVLNESGEKQ